MQYRLSIVFALSIFMASTPRAEAFICSQPIYQGLQTGAVLRFLGETGAQIYREHGTIQTNSPRHVFQFTTTHSNGLSTEYLMLKGFATEESVMSVVSRKNADFTNTEGPAPYLLTPELFPHFYYATSQAGQGAMHAIRLDDTWKRIGCGAH